jgi:ankyrin repeat protein
LDATSSYAGSVAISETPSSTRESDKIPTSSIAELSIADSEGLIPTSTEPSITEARVVRAADMPIRAHEPEPDIKRIPIKVDRSLLTKRTPKSSQGATSAALQRTLFSAVEGKKIKIVETLLDRGVPPDTGPETNSVVTATLNRDTPTLKLLLEFGADPDAPDKRGITPLRMSCENREEQAKLLLEWGADPNISAPNWTALAWACDSKQESIVGLLLQYGADPDLKSENGETGLVYACARLFGPAMIQQMLDWNADPNKKNKQGRTPLQGACEVNQPEVVKLLLDRGADPNMPGTQLPLKVSVNKPECLRLLISAGADPSLYKGLMELATWENSIQSVEILLAAGVDPQEKHAGSFTPLTTAIRDNRMEIFQFLIKSGADPNAKGQNMPLKMAVERPHFIVPLLSAGGDLSQADGIMEWASYHNNLEVSISGQEVEERFC